MRQGFLACLLILLGFLLGGFVGGAIGNRYDSEVAQRIEAEGKLVDFLPVITFLDACIGATVGTLTAFVISFPILRSRTMKPRLPSEFE
jgi:ABC-type branched-subunit amino acid transport system permease subunit